MDNTWAEKNSEVERRLLEYMRSVRAEYNISHEEMLAIFDPLNSSRGEEVYKVRPELREASKKIHDYYDSTLRNIFSKAG